MEMGDFPMAMRGHDEAVGHHHPHGDAARRLEALREDGGEVLEELAANHNGVEPMSTSNVWVVATSAI